MITLSVDVLEESRLRNECFSLVAKLLLVFVVLPGDRLSSVGEHLLFGYGINKDFSRSAAEGELTRTAQCAEYIHGRGNRMMISVKKT